MSWNYNKYQDTLTFHVKVRTTGWVAFGFALKAPNMMMGYDVVVGGVNSTGSTYLYVSRSYMHPYSHNISYIAANRFTYL